LTAISKRAAALLRSKIFIWIVLVIPGLWAAVPILRQDPTVMADPLKYLLHHFGFVACVLLAVVLSLSPWRVLFPRWDVALAVNRHRRLLGVSVFAYAVLHLTAQFLHESGWPTFWHDLRKPFLAAGIAIFLILFVLSVTSVNAVARRLGRRRWKRIHRLIYPAAGLAAYHQAAARKLFPMQVVWIFGPVVILEIARIVRLAMNRRDDARRGSPADHRAAAGSRAA
jgi:sulfoxide reductase heme-binding subunit YedZ